MAFLRKGFLKSANRRNELYCRINFSLVALIVFSPLLVIFMVLPHLYHGVFVDLVLARHTHKLPGAIREDAIKIYIQRDGTLYFRSSLVHCNDLPDMIRVAVRNGAEKRIYLEVDARARNSAVSAVFSQIQLTGIQDVSILADSPDRISRLPSRPTQ